MGARAGPVLDARVPHEPELLGALGERLGDQLDGLRAIVAQGQRVAGELQIPGVQAGARAHTGAQAREQRVALREHARVGAALAVAQRPEGGDELVEVCAANARWALEQLQALGHEDAQQRSLRKLDQALDGRAVTAHALDRARVLGQRAVADGQLVLALAVADTHADPRSGLAEAHQLALVARPRRAPGAAEVDRLEQVGLARAVGPVHDGQARPERGLGAGVGAKVAQLDAEHAHAGLRQTLRRIGMIRYTNCPPSGDSITPGRSGLMSFRTSSSDSTLSSPSRRNSGLKPMSNGSP